MSIQNLTISGIDYNTNKNISMTLKASNIFMLIQKYLKVVDNVIIEDWTLINNEMSGGNTGMNAGAYLCETLQEFTKIDLR